MENKNKYLFDIKYTDSRTNTIKTYYNLKLIELHDLLQDIPEAKNIHIKTKIFTSV